MHIVEKEFKESIGDLNNDHYFIAYSGGVDSQVLLHLAAKYLPNKVTALHVNHGISDNAFAWENACKETAESLSVTFDVARFDLKNKKSNLEEVARKLRYDFFEKAMSDNDVILTGHHLDDQAETFMLRLMRGSGVDGLASMSSIRPLNKGFLARPLLNVTKEEIYDYALKEKLSWVEDESNKSSDYDRNFIRNEVLPLLKTRWGKASHSIARSAKHCEETKEATREKSEELLKTVLVDDCLDVKKIELLEDKEQKMVVRSWLKNNNLLMPSEKNLDVILKEVIFSRSGSKSCFKMQNYEMKKSFDKVYLIFDGLTPEFGIVDNCLVETNVSKLKMQYKGTLRTFKYIMKAEKIPYWERSHYFASMNGSEVMAFGDIRKS